MVSSFRNRPTRITNGFQFIVTAKRTEKPPQRPDTSVLASPTDLIDNTFHHHQSDMEFVTHTESLYNYEKTSLQ